MSLLLSSIGCRSSRRRTGLVSYFQMPFANGARLEIENQSDETISRLYFYIDYVEMKKTAE